MHLDTVKLQDYLKFVPRSDSPFTRKRRSYHHGDLRRALVNAAVSLLTKTQRWDFSLREVARCAGVSHNAPYSHFASKRELLAAVAAKGYEILRARVLTALRGKTKPADALKAILITYLRFGTGNPARYRLMFGPELQGQDAGLPSEVIHAFTSVEAVYRGVLKRGSEGRTFPKMTRLLWRWQQSALGHWSTASPCFISTAWRLWRPRKRLTAWQKKS
jgi:AcrR family transcriptional regulator